MSNEFATLIASPTVDNCEQVHSAACSLIGATDAGMLALGALLCSVGANKQDGYELEPHTLFQAGWLLTTLVNLQEQLREVEYTAEKLQGAKVSAGETKRGRA